MKNYFFNLTIISLCIYGLSLNVNANTLTRKEKRLLRKAENHFLFEEYSRAFPYYAELLQTDSTNALTNFHAGICYYYSETENEKALHILENAKKYIQSDTIPDLYYYLALANQHENNFQEAITNYQKLISFIKPKATEDIAEIDSNIAACKNGIALMQHPVNVRIENLGAGINSSFPDYAPVISANESILIFTSKRKGTGGKIADDGLYYEDIYSSKKISGEEWNASLRLDSTADKFPAPRGFQKIFFSRAKNIGKAINTNFHDASIAISADGTKLLIYKNYSIWISELKNDAWQKPQRLDKNINTKNSYNPSACFSADEKILYVVSERAGGFGGKDIYQSSLQADGTWSPLQNLGPKINTALDEESPFVTADGKTLYFSSQGHNSIGGFDVFKSTLENGKWGKPQNMGYPINEGGNDIFFTMNAAGTHGYYSTERHDTYGGLDIYMIDFETNKVDSLAKASLMALKKDSTAKANDSIASIALAEKTKADSIASKLSGGGKNIFSNTDFVYFDFDKSTVKTIYYPGMDSVYKYLKENTLSQLTLTGYCDSKGTTALNKALSLKRAKMVERYFTEKGIPKKQILLTGAGSSDPIAPNTNPDGSDNPAGRAKNRRVAISVSKK
ncbi:MAG: OmpA family protein [Bacteroidia bacterium]